LGHAFEFGGEEGGPFFSCFIIYEALVKLRFGPEGQGEQIRPKSFLFTSTILPLHAKKYINIVFIEVPAAERWK
ncbi:hypothetical protein KC221_30990, partial [Mycobacterium tuberculosis]|nr:hypothetical protein [Mycobacterium tuberculosis]